MLITASKCLPCLLLTLFLSNDRYMEEVLGVKWLDGMEHGNNGGMMKVMRQLAGGLNDTVKDK